MGVPFAVDTCQLLGVWWDGRTSLSTSEYADGMGTCSFGPGMESSLSVSNMQDPSSSLLEKQQSSANGNGDLDSEGSSLEEIGFNWGEYLEETGASAAPHASFKHVEISIQSNFQPGMKLEVANKSNPDTYWVATVITTCGQLLLLRYCGCGEDRRADFWCDVVTADLHPVGWCTQNNKALVPPDGGCKIRDGAAADCEVPRDRTHQSVAIVSLWTLRTSALDGPFNVLSDPSVESLREAFSTCELTHLRGTACSLGPLAVPSLAMPHGPPPLSCPAPGALSAIGHPLEHCLPSCLLDWEASLGELL
ncbi:hypothetical protein MC885_000441 [Smutsia gigantea]|nr:hypothetical protein MC885_000441 [Smutsia gigantea]